MLQNLCIRVSFMAIPLIQILQESKYRSEHSKYSRYILIAKKLVLTLHWIALSRKHILDMIVDLKMEKSCKPRICKTFFVCLVRVHSIINLSCHEQIRLMMSVMTLIKKFVHDVWTCYITSIINCSFETYP